MAYYKVITEEETAYYTFTPTFKRKLIESEGCYKVKVEFGEEEAEMNANDEIQQSEFDDKADDVAADLKTGSHPPSRPH
jgi:hypothetical protein